MNHRCACGDNLLIDRGSDLSFFNLLSSSYCRFLGRRITPEGMKTEQAARWLYEDAPFAILAHDTAPDPVFVYGNMTAQRRFEYTWEELIGLPSRLSAEACERSERQQFLDQVCRDGFATGYSGIRIAKTGKSFRIENATIWQLIDAAGICRGQAALLPTMIDMQTSHPMSTSESG